MEITISFHVHQLVAIFSFINVSMFAKKEIDVLLPISCSRIFGYISLNVSHMAAIVCVIMKMKEKAENCMIFTSECIDKCKYTFISTSTLEPVTN